MMSSWIQRMNKRERVLASIVAAVVFITVNLFIWSSLSAADADARAIPVPVDRQLSGGKLRVDVDRPSRDAVELVAAKRLHAGNGQLLLRVRHYECEFRE